MWRVGLLVHGVRVEPRRSRLSVGIYRILMTQKFRGQCDKVNDVEEIHT